MKLLSANKPSLIFYFSSDSSARLSFSLIFYFPQIYLRCEVEHFQQNLRTRISSQPALYSCWCSGSRCHSSGLPSPPSPSQLPVLPGSSPTFPPQTSSASRQCGFYEPSSKYTSKQRGRPVQGGLHTFLHCVHCLPTPECVIDGQERTIFWWVHIYIYIYYILYTVVELRTLHRYHCTTEKIWPPHQEWPRWFLHRSARPPHVAPPPGRLSWTWVQVGWQTKRLQKAPREESKSWKIIRRRRRNNAA